MQLTRPVLFHLISFPMNRSAKPRFLRHRHCQRNRCGNGRGGGRYWTGGGNGRAGSEHNPQATLSGDDPRVLIRTLMRNRNNIERTVDYEFTNGHDANPNKNGVRTVTQAKPLAENREQINDWIFAHANEMKQYVKDGNTIRNWDGLFRQIFENKGLLDLDCKQPGGSGTKVVCTHTSDDSYGEALCKGHAEFVSRLLADKSTKDNDNAYLIDKHYHPHDQNK